MKIIVLIGMPACGKSTHANFLGDIPLYETGTFVFREVEQMGLEITPENIKKVSVDLKNKSDSYFTERAVEEIRKKHPDKVACFLSGLRAVSEVEYLKREF